MTPLLRLENLSKFFVTRNNSTTAVNDFSLDIHRGEMVGLAGVSGCGKTTLGKMIVRLITPSSGAIYFEGKRLSDQSTQEMRTLRRKLQIVLQDPYGSLNPRLTVEAIINEGLKIHKINPQNRIEQILEAVGLSNQFLKRFPHQLSGGQRQRVNIARALVLEPDFLVLDESVSALDISHQKQILELLKSLQQRFQLTYLFISHDLSVLKTLCSRIGVMQQGRLIEIGTTELIMSAPQHKHTQELIASIPILDPLRERERRKKKIEYTK